MKKILITLLICLSFIDAPHALIECKVTDLSTYRQELNNVDINYIYQDEYLDMNGDNLEGYFKVNFKNLPSNFHVMTKKNDGHLDSSSKNGIILSGGIYKLEFYNEVCSNPIKIIELRIPYYKQFPYEKIKNNPWFDGTYENKKNILEEKKEQKEKSTINKKLVIIVISLLVIILIFVTVYILKRRNIK